tara:strand:- start:170 stop:1129 length:960 start_codon:yes stop_codon:yes gene_type:complete
MSMIHKGHIVESEQSKNANGGTEMMRKRLLDNVDFDLLGDVAIHFSRPRHVPADVEKNILYCHDLAQDPENAVLRNEKWKQFDHFVFVSQWQRDQYNAMYGIPHSKCSVIQNAVETVYEAREKPTEQIRFIYHTTPHRGLELLYPVFDALTKVHDNIHLDVFSSFSIYGWEQRDEPYRELFMNLTDHPNITYHGAQPNSVVLDALLKSHVFLYPNIWQETSCIAMIEAIRSGVLCVHPNLGALSETTANSTIMYNYNENKSDHANIAYAYAKQVLDIQKDDPTFISRMTNNQKSQLYPHTIEIFKSNWTKLLLELRANG